MLCQCAAFSCFAMAHRVRAELCQSITMLLFPSPLPRLSRLFQSTTILSNSDAGRRLSLQIPRMAYPSCATALPTSLCLSDAYLYPSHPLPLVTSHAVRYLYRAIQLSSEPFRHPSEPVRCLTFQVQAHLCLCPAARFSSLLVRSAQDLAFPRPIKSWLCNSSASPWVSLPSLSPPTPR